MAHRYDLAECTIRHTPTPTGGIRVEARMTRIGVFPYALATGGTRRELRPPEEVFAPESLATLRGAAVTELHPVDADGNSVMVDAENWSDLAVGHVGDTIRQNGDFVEGDALVQRASTIGRVVSGDLVENSCGYECDLDETPGVFGGEPYDAIQRKIRYNHLALGPKGWGRGGPNVRLRTDSACAIREAQTPHPETRMATHRIDGIEYEIGSASHVAAVDKTIATLTDRASKAEARADSAESRARDAEALASPRAIARAAARRADLLAFARTQTKLGVAYRKDEGEGEAEPVDNAQIMRDLIAQMAPDLDVSGMAAPVLEGVLRGLMYAKNGAPAAEAEAEAEPATDAEDPPMGTEDKEKAPALDSLTSARGVRRRADAAPEPSEAEALRRMRERNAVAWMKGKR